MHAIDLKQVYLPRLATRGLDLDPAVLAFELGARESHRRDREALPMASDVINANILAEATEPQNLADIFRDADGRIERVK